MYKTIKNNGGVMRNKKCYWFLWISFILFALSVIAVILNVVVSYYKVSSCFSNDDMRITDELVAIVFVSIWMTIPTLGAELSFIRSVYKILKNKPKGWIKIFYISSASLATIAFVLYFLVIFGLIRCVGHDGYSYSADVLLFIEWPFCIVSFILGSVPIKHNN